MDSEMVKNQREEKQSTIENSLNNLRNEVNKLEEFIDRVESNNESKDLPGLEKQEKAQRPSLSNFINQLPNEIDIFSKRIENYVLKLKELLY